MPIAEPVASAARRAAARLASEVDPNLPALTERAIATGETPDTQDPVRSFEVATAVAVGALLLSIVQFAWTVYRDLKADREKERARREEKAARVSTPPREVVLRRLRVEYPVERFRSREQRDRVLAVVVDEVMEVDRPPSR